jgi:DNA polymerase-1
MTTPPPRVLIDTEVYLYRAAAACEVETEWAPDDWTYTCRHGDAKAQFQDMIGEIRSTVPDHRVTLVFSDRSSFRYGVWPQYKANRKRYRRPAGYRQLVEWVHAAGPAREWEVACLPDIEGDDVLGVLYQEGDVIASVDKDILTIPGLHLRDGEILEVNRLQADRAFYSQVLTGDATDNYPGCPGCGPVAAEKALAGCTTEAEMWAAVVSAYARKALSPYYAITQARCARILRAGEYDMENQAVRLWVPPVG